MSHCGFDLHFPDDQWCWASIHVLVGYLYVFFTYFIFNVLFYYIFFNFKKDFIYLFLERGKGKEKERERNVNEWLPLICSLLGTWPATQHVPWLGIELATFWFIGSHSIHWAAPARAILLLFRERGREREREGEKHRLTAFHTRPNWGPNLWLRHVSWPGIKLATLHSVERRPTNWATPVGSSVCLL